MSETYSIELLDGDADLDGVLEVEAESFTNPWTREMYEAGRKASETTGSTEFFQLPQPTTLNQCSLTTNSNSRKTAMIKLGKLAPIVPKKTLR